MTKTVTSISIGHRKLTKLLKKLAKILLIAFNIKFRKLGIS